MRHQAGQSLVELLLHRYIEEALARVARLTLTVPAMQVPRLNWTTIVHCKDSAILAMMPSPAVQTLRALEDTKSYAGQASLDGQRSSSRAHEAHCAYKPSSELIASQA